MTTIPRPASSTVITLLVVVTVIGLTGHAIASFDQAAYNEHRNASEDWCNEYNGSLGPGESHGKHAQLHCYTEDDRSVHMGEVAAMNYTHNWDQIDDRAGARHENTPLFFAMPLEDVLPIFGITIGLVGFVTVLGYAKRWRVDEGK